MILRNVEKTFSAKWKPFLSDFPFKTHEIDLVRGFRNTNEETIIEAIEVKYFKKAKKERRYTEGFGQALGLLLWGFDFVTVYHIFFDQKFDESERKRFVKTAGELSRSLKLIGYRAFLGKKEKEIQMYQLTNSGDVTENPLSYIQAHSRTLYYN